MVVQKTTNKEAGFVSLFTVIFFILMMTVITVGFLRVMGIEQQQALDNDLTASAVAAAESGIEDGKRAILAHNTTADPTLKADLGAAFASNECNALTSYPSIRNALGIDQAGNYIGNDALNQSYTCLMVDLNSPDYINRQAAGVSDFIPLVADGGQFQDVRISWHLISQTPGADGDGTPDSYAPGPLLLPLVDEDGTNNSWSGQGYPAYLRVQLYGHPTGAFSRADLEARSRTLLLAPSQSGTNAFSFNDDTRGYEQSKAVLKQVRCINNPAGNLGTYACTATVSLPSGLSSANNNFYLRVTPFYGPSHFRVVLLNGGNPVDMQGVQPIIDATGRTADVFRRLQARVRVNPVGDLPEFVAQSAETICKNMEVSDGSYYQPNDCEDED